MTSRLAEATSPYLRAHADNPVHWYPWGTEAFEVAASRDVPVLVSIGYSTCHWCHVMARESFADPATAEIIYAGFVAIKVDREEHPAVDEAFLAAAAAFTPSLGWPLTAFTTPQGKPFFAGTYWPDQARNGLPAFRDVLAAVTEGWRERRAQIESTGDGVQNAIRRVVAGAADNAAEARLPTPAERDEARDRILATEDPIHGGFGGGGARFPLATTLQFLQTSSAGRAAVDRALRAMIHSPLFDDIDGGFFRYATQPDWSDPHYERMLVDNAQLLDVASVAGDVVTVAAIAGFLANVLQQPSGGFGAAQDAESIVDGERSAGGYYAGTRAQRARWAAPSVDGKILMGWNGLAISALARAAVRHDVPALATLAEQAALAVVSGNQLQRAAGTEHPHRSDAPSPGNPRSDEQQPEEPWQGGSDSDESRPEASRTDDRSPNEPRLEASGPGEAWPAGQRLDSSPSLFATQAPATPLWVRASIDEIPGRALATAADLAQFSGGLVDLALASGKVEWAVLGRELAIAARTAPRDAVLDSLGIPPSPESSDGDEPSDRASRALAERTLFVLGAGQEFADEAHRLVAGGSAAALASPRAHGALLRAATALGHAPRQLVVVATDPSTPENAAVIAAARASLDTLDVLAVVSPVQARAFADAGFDLFAGRDGQEAAYLCEDFLCRLPITDADELTMQLSTSRAAP